MKVIDCTLDTTDGIYKPSHEVSSIVLTKRPFKGAVYLQGNCFYTNARGMWKGMGYEVTDDPELADIICWLGGADISPEIYGEKNVASGGVNKSQDASDLAMVHKAGNRFKVGICRGAQLLNCIPNGGSLWQDISGHPGSHFVTDALTKRSYLTNSIHHQQMRPGPDAELVGWTTCSFKKECEKEVWHRGVSDTSDSEEKDIEALWYDKTKSLLVQWHPELGSHQSTEYFESLMERYYLAA